MSQPTKEQLAAAASDGRAMADELRERMRRMTTPTCPGCDDLRRQLAAERQRAEMAARELDRLAQRGNRLEVALRAVLAEYEYQVGPFDKGHEPDVIREARQVLSSARKTE